VIFSAITLVTAIPLLEVLFNQKEGTALTPRPEFSVSVQYLVALFEHHLIRIINEYGKPSALLFVCICTVISITMANTFRYLERIIASRVRLDVVKNLRSDFFKNVTRLQISFFNETRKGDLISRFTSDVAEVENAVMQSLKAVFKEPITIIVYFAILFYISTKLTLITLIGVPLVGGVVAEIIRRLKKEAKESQESLGRVVSTLEETFGGMRVVKAFNARNYIMKKMDDENAHNTRVNMSMAYKNEMASPMSEFLGVMLMSMIMYYGGSQVLSESPEIGAPAFFGFLTLFASLIQPAKSFSGGITSLQKGIASGRRVFELIDTEPIIENKPNAVKLETFSDRIEYRNVTFAYNKEPVLKDINLVIPKGATVALVGPSGSGKSTLADLVPRFYDPKDGDVLIDGISIKDYDIESLRSHMGIVTQEPILFNDTIFNNIAFGSPNATDEAIMNAARIANAHDFIMQTERGYQSMIGERGSKLSGGQRQRLSIARAVLKNPPILILDEATSALDSESEKLVQEALFNLMRNRTSLVIAHRLSTIRNADEIIVIQEGGIIERGTHLELTKLNGIYRKLSEIQTTEA
jgi:subfamily B ATP-binding cassette protein MsbA